MHAAGLDAYEKRDESKTINYSYELRAATLGPAYEKRFKANRKPGTFSRRRRRPISAHARFWVTTAKKEETRDRRLDILIADSAAGRRLAAATPGKKTVGDAPSGRPR